MTISLDTLQDSVRNAVNQFEICITKGEITKKERRHKAAVLALLDDSYQDTSSFITALICLNNEMDRFRWYETASWFTNQSRLSAVLMFSIRLASDYQSISAYQNLCDQIEMLQRTVKHLMRENANLKAMFSNNDSYRLWQKKDAIPSAEVASSAFSPPG